MTCTRRTVLAAGVLAAFSIAVPTAFAAKPLVRVGALVAEPIFTGAVTKRDMFEVLVDEAHGLGKCPIVIGVCPRTTGLTGATSTRCSGC